MEPLNTSSDPPVAVKFTVVSARAIGYKPQLASAGTHMTDVVPVACPVVDHVGQPHTTEDQAVIPAARLLVKVRFHGSCACAPRAPVPTTKPANFNLVPDRPRRGSVPIS